MTKTSHARASEYLTSAFVKKDDLTTGPRRFLVTDVEEAESFDKSRPVLQLVLDDAQRFTLNATNTRRMIQHFGDNVSAWRGARITLYLDDAVAFKGKEVGGIRVRPTGVPAPPATPREAAAWAAHTEAEAQAASDDADVPF
jgi:hypothetical protein